MKKVIGIGFRFGKLVAREYDETDFDKDSYSASNDDGEYGFMSIFAIFELNGTLIREKFKLISGGAGSQQVFIEGGMGGLRPVRPSDEKLAGQTTPKVLY